MHPPSLSSWYLLWTQVWFPMKLQPRKETEISQWWFGSGVCPAVRVAAPQPGSICWWMHHWDCVCQGWLPLALGKVGWKMYMTCSEGTVTRNNIKILRGAGDNVVEWCTWKQAQLYLLLMEWFFFTRRNCWGCCLCLTHECPCSCLLH